MNPIVQYYGDCFTQHGDTAQGAGWPNESDLRLRFDVALDLVERIAPGGGRVELCDLGCGSARLLEHALERGIDRIDYLGVDVLEGPLARARAKFPDARLLRLDLARLEPADVEALSCDILVANGLFTVKREMDHDAMWSFMTDLLIQVWPVVRKGVVFNVMSPIVDWERGDLFHVSYDRMASFLHGLAGRHIGFRADYGLYEYMAYAMRGLSLEREPDRSSEVGGDLDTKI